jgi:hypothetical protein
MPAISRDSLMSLETYARTRAQFRARVLEHKKARCVQLGSNVRLIFEDELTVRYQIQEMLRAERIFEEEDIRAELEVYASLVPDGSNWKATMMIEYIDPEERLERLGQLIGIEDLVWLQVAGYPRVFAIADEDLERENESKTSAVHFLRFELQPAMVSALKAGARLSAGIDHPHYRAHVETVDSTTVASLAEDLTT